METHAKPDGDDWIINGSKLWITNANLADVAMVWARTPKGVAGFLVERGMAGFSTNPIHHRCAENRKAGRDPIAPCG